MAEYIKREAAYEKCGWYNTVNGKSVCAVRKDEIASIPAADVAPVVHGEWIETYHEGYEMWGYDCSECDDGFAMKERCKSKPNFCHNCGADMRERKCDDA